ncbi:TPA: hypothetical protein ACH3X3_012188 [Trebouxia sp. C0006]
MSSSCFQLVQAAMSILRWYKCCTNYALLVFSLCSFCPLTRCLCTLHAVVFKESGCTGNLQQLFVPPRREQVLLESGKCPLLEMYLTSHCDSGQTSCQHATRLSGQHHLYTGKLA